MVLTGETEVLGEKRYIAWVVDGWMGMEQWWNGTDRGKLKCREKTLSQCHLVHHKTHIEMNQHRTRACTVRQVTL